MSGTSHWLVEQQQLRLHGERDRKLQCAFLAMGELGRSHVRAFGESDLRQGGKRCRVQLGLVGRAAEKAETRTMPRLNGERDILLYRKPGQDGGDLERAGKPARSARMNRQAGDIFPGKSNAPGIRRNQARDLVDQGGLAGAVRSDHGVQLARHHIEREVVGDAQAAEAL